MKPDRKRRLEKAGWKFGSAQDFLGLTDAEAAIVDMRVSLARELRRHRLAHRASQVALAKVVGSSQSRVARMEAGHSSVSLDLLVRALLSSGSTPAAIGRAIAKKRRP